ncbi:copper chaperone CopZ [Alkalicoccobacillus porphyridii]|uniref:Copper chaperone CopZ n=1 Tax=Alkalicoccobacillus porphyridii TaxID=2597270 RepID=A0A553ZX47_9BACI|nr:copper chaperone CopZ [Alkalicoccobacillus porphyridii]TSB45965.1 copper chaperone CopZ [Alkalicoccobacillus porphyridii]
MKSITLNVKGMSCGHCVQAIEGAVGELEGVEEVKVSLEEASVKISFDENVTGQAKIEEVIDDQGYDVA